MSSTQSSEESPSEDELEQSQRARGNSTPRTPLSPQDVFPKVRFTGVNTPSKDQTESSLTPQTTKFASAHENDDNTEKSVVEPHAELLDRINSLENQIHDLELLRQPISSERGDDSSERTGLSTEIQWMSWQEYLEDASKASNVLEVLIEKPHSNSRRKSSAVSPAFESLQKASVKSPTSPSKNIERIRIRSPHLINALQAITEQTFSSSSRLIIHRPFKVLLFYHEQISEYLAELEETFAQNTQCHLGRRCKGFIAPGDDVLDLQSTLQAGRASARRDSYEKSPHRRSSDPNPTRVGDNECKHEISEELLAQKEAITHLRILKEFMREDMKEVFAKHYLLRSSEAETVAFIDLWHLFMAGDFIVAEEESSGRGLELYQLSILPACDVFSSRRPVKQIQTRTEGSQHLVESVYKEEVVSAMSIFTVDVFYFDFDGQKFGPVEKRMQLASFEGEKKITDLPMYPLRFRKDASEFEAKMLERGQKFRELSNTIEYPHREYNGLSIGEPQEQIDSQVIIDFALAYRKHPKSAPKFGLRSWIEDDARIVPLVASTRKRADLIHIKLDEADVFLQARDRENMRRNSVVSVFLRVLEYYSGILFLTTNKVGHFDEAFKARIHVSLYYPPLDKRSTLKIWKMNLGRLMKSKKALDVEAEEIYEYARQHFKELSKNKRPTWNGRQIKNAFQTAIALAEFDANRSQGKPVLALEHFKVVAQVSEDFDQYLFGVHGGTDADIARLHGQRDDEPRDSRSHSTFFTTTKPKSKKYESSDSSSSETSDAEEKKKQRKKDKRQKKKDGKSTKFNTKAKDLESGSESSSSESE
ncbi:hypothetical protein P7C71_g314, partial [Lecanoromycetidae sp. Uapishka_2]